jgi:hypothetical protein
MGARALSPTPRHRLLPLVAALACGCAPAGELVATVSVQTAAGPSEATIECVSHDAERYTKTEGFPFLAEVKRHLLRVYTRLGDCDGVPEALLFDEIIVRWSSADMDVMGEEAGEQAWVKVWLKSGGDEVEGATAAEPTEIPDEPGGPYEINVEQASFANLTAEYCDCQGLTFTAMTVTGEAR